MRKRLLLLSAYDAPSHAYWRPQLRNQLAEFEWTELCLPRDTLTGESAAMHAVGIDRKRQVSERLRSRSGHLNGRSRQSARADPKISSRSLPSYFHENQFVYPAGASVTKTLSPRSSLFTPPCVQR